MSESGEAGVAILRLIAEKLPAMLAYWDAGLKCRFANRAYERWFGVAPETMIGRDMESFLGPLFKLNLPYIQGALRGEEQEFEREIPDPAGGPARHSQAHYIPDVVDGEVRGFCVLVVDITRRKRAEDALRKVERQLHATERLAAMSTLAAGIAHEINNPLAAVLGNVELALTELAPPAPQAPMLQDALAAARRVAEIVKGMRLLARGDTPKAEPVDVDDAVEKSVALATNVIRYRARLVRDLHAPGFVAANASQLAQVLVNLLVNAAQALPESDTARNEIRVSTRLEGRDVVIAVADNGCGIPPELQERIFEPFFTTRGVGGGTGLGLSIARSLVTAAGGTITVRSAVNEGSVFEVRLPALPAAPVQSAFAPAPPVAASAARVRLLVVDDDELLSRTLRLALTPELDVDVLNGGAAAIEELCTRPDAHDVVLCDLMMPGVTGADVYERVTAEHPALASRFVFMTGGAFTARGREFLASVRAPVLDKPFELAKLRELLKARGGS